MATIKSYTDIEQSKKWAEMDEIEIPFGAKDSELQEVTYYIPKGFHAEIEGDKVVIKKGEKKPVDKCKGWTKKDEACFKSALWHITNSISNGKETNVESDLTDWLDLSKTEYNHA